MGNRVIRIVLGITIGIAALIGIFLVLPASFKNPLIEKFQSTFQKDKYEVITYLKAIQVPGNEGINLGDMIDKCGKRGSWVIDESDVGEDGKSGTYQITALVTDVDLSMAQENGQDNRKNFTQATVEIGFSVTRAVGKDPEYVVSSYQLVIDDVGQNNFYRQEALNSMVKLAKQNHN